MRLSHLAYAVLGGAAFGREKVIYSDQQSATVWLNGKVSVAKTRERSAS